MFGGNTGKCSNNTFLPCDWQYLENLSQWVNITQFCTAEVVDSLTITSLSSMSSAAKWYLGNCIEILPSSMVTGTYREKGDMSDGCDYMTLAWQVLNESYLLTLNFEPIIVTNSHSWPMLNLLDQVQLGMVCVQVKSFPFWSTSVITLWSVLALSSPVTAKLKWMETQIDPFLANTSRGKSVYQLLRGTPHNCLDSPAHISQWKTWCWKRAEGASKELIRQEQEWPAEDTDFLFAFERLPTSASPSLSYLITCLPRMCGKNVNRCFSKILCPITFC